MLNITCHHRNTNQNHKSKPQRVLLASFQVGYNDPYLQILTACVCSTLLQGWSV